MIYFLILTLLMLSIFILGSNRNSLLSISLFSCFSFLFASLVYAANMIIISKDVSLRLSVTIIISIIVMFLGEFLGRHIKLKTSKPRTINIIPEEARIFFVSKSHTKIIFLLMVIVFLIRYIDLYQFSRTLGNNNIFSTISSTRFAYAMGQYSSTTFLMKIATISTLISEFLAYSYMYFFSYNFVFHKVVTKHLLYPVVGYFLIISTFTGRNQYIFAGVVWMTVILFLVEKSRKRHSLDISVLKKASRYFLFAIVGFLLYGILARNNDGEQLGLQVTITSYFGASLFGLDLMFDKLLYGINGQEMVFGYYTLQNLYSFFNKFGADFPIPIFHHLPFFSYGGGSSNVYTSLLYPILDYGIWGMFFSRFIIGVISGGLQSFVVGLNCQKKSSIKWVVLLSILAYNAISAAIADRYQSNLLAPDTMIKYTFFAGVVIRFFVKVKRINIDECN